MRFGGKPETDGPVQVPVPVPVPVPVLTSCACLCGHAYHHDAPSLLEVRGGGSSAFCWVELERADVRDLAQEHQAGPKEQ